MEEEGGGKKRYIAFITKPAAKFNSIISKKLQTIILSVASENNAYLQNIKIRLKYKINKNSIIGYTPADSK